MCRTEEAWRKACELTRGPSSGYWHKNYAEKGLAMQVRDGRYSSWDSSGGEYYATHEPYSDFPFIQFDNNTKKMTKTVSSMAKKLLDADSQALVQAGFISESLTITQEGSDALREIMFDKYKKELVAVAKSKIKEEKE